MLILYVAQSTNRMLSLFKEFFIIAVLTSVGVAYSLFSGHAPAPWVEAELDAGEIHMVDASVINPIWVDARPEADYAEDHIATALSLNETNWDDGIFSLMGEWLESPRPIVVYCSSSSCDTSKRVAERLRNELSDAEVYSLHGGWQP
ncbi:MAG: rhodanese-like domain-containing protein [Lentimonas sp.]